MKYFALCKAEEVEIAAENKSLVLLFLKEELLESSVNVLVFFLPSF